MPCVLPVLSLKVLSMLKKSGKELKTVRRSFLVSSAGIICSFLLLAALVVGLQMAGKTVGWGFQFQEPYFLIVLSLILAFFAANLFGFFELQLPQGINNWIHHKAGGKQGYTEHFLTGAFATLMATPCSAPFLGTAIGFAFSQGALETFALFFAMGVGLSIPYLLFVAFPKLVRLFPKPGAWMVKAKAILGGLLLLTAAWVIWVLAAQKGVIISAAVGALVLLIIAAFKLPVRYRKITIAALVIACFALPLALNHTEVAEVKTGLWQPFDKEKIQANKQSK
jgi:suppressor for copper-sensitivity B